MNIESLVRMIGRRILGRLINRGIDAGIKRVMSNGKGAANAGPEQQAQAKQARDLAKRTRQAARVVRRVGR